MTQQKRLSKREIRIQEFQNVIPIEVDVNWTEEEGYMLVNPNWKQIVELAGFLHTVNEQAIVETAIDKFMQGYNTKVKNEFALVEYKVGWERSRKPKILETSYDIEELQIKMDNLETNVNPDIGHTIARFDGENLIDYYTGKNIE